MIRVALIVFGFIAITLTLILMQPPVPGQIADAPLADGPAVQEVSRAETALDEVPGPSDAAAADTATAPTGPTAPVEAENAPVMPDPTPTPRSPQTLEGLIITALQEGQNEDYIDALVNHAAETGDVKVPGHLVTAEGRVDTATLLTVLSRAPDVMRAGGRTYTVQPGDSLAALSFRFFGTTQRVEDIIEANQGLLSEGGLAIGQDLVIPPK